MDTDLVAPAISLVAVAIPLAASFLSGNRHLREMRDQTRTLDSLPEGHPARTVISEEIEHNARRYRIDQQSRWTRHGLRLGFVLVLLGAAAIISAESLRGESDTTLRYRESAEWALLIGGYVSILGAYLVLGMLAFRLFERVRKRAAKKRRRAAARAERGPDPG